MIFQKRIENANPKKHLRRRRRQCVMSKHSWKQVCIKLWSNIWWIPAFWPLAFFIWSVRNVWEILIFFFDSLSKTGAGFFTVSSDSVPRSHVNSWQQLLAKFWSYLRWLPVFWPVAFLVWTVQNAWKILVAFSQACSRTRDELSKAAASDSVPTAEALPPFIVLASLILQVDSCFECFRFN